MADAPIGIFDSGFGGLTVARAVLDQLPHEPVLYYGDTARAPYGPRPIAEVRAFALECLDHLVGRGVKMLVIAWLNVILPVPLPPITNTSMNGVSDGPAAPIWLSLYWNA